MPARLRSAPRRRRRRCSRPRSRRARTIRLRRNGSRGLFWLEPLVEVECAAGRDRLRSGAPRATCRRCSTRACSTAARIRCGSAPIEEHPWFASQQRLTFARVGVIDPLDLDDYDAHGGFRGPAARARARGPRDIVDEVLESGLRGRGGAAFPTGIKWQTVLDQPAGAEIHRLQRRRGRLGHVLRPHADGGRSVRADRRHDDRGRRGRRDPGLHLSARRISARVPGPERGDRGGARARATSAPTSAAAAGVRHRSAPRRRRLHLRRRDRDARKPRRPARRDPRAPAAAGDQGPVRRADRRQQRDHARDGADRSSREGAAVYRDFGLAQVARHAAAAARRQRAARRPGRAGVRPHAARAAVRLRRRHGERTADPRGAGRRAARRLPAGVAVRHAARLRGAVGDRRACSATAASSCSTTPSTCSQWRATRWSSARIESCGKCTPCRIGSVRGVEVLGEHLPGRIDRTRQSCAAWRSSAIRCCRLAVRAGRHDAVSGAERAEALPRGLQAARRPEADMYAIDHNDLGTPAAASRRAAGRRSRSTARRSPCPAGTSVMRAAALAGGADPEALRHRHA